MKTSSQNPSHGDRLGCGGLHRLLHPPMALESKTRSPGADLVSETDSQSQQLFCSPQLDTSLRPQEWDHGGQAWKWEGGSVSFERPGTRWPALGVVLVPESPDAVSPAGGPSTWCVISQGKWGNPTPRPLHRLAEAKGSRESWSWGPTLASVPRCVPYPRCSSTDTSSACLLLICPSNTFETHCRNISILLLPWIPVGAGTIIISLLWQMQIRKPQVCGRQET